MNLTIQFGFDNPHDKALEALALQKALLAAIAHLAELPFETIALPPFPFSPHPVPTVPPRD